MKSKIDTKCKTYSKVRKKSNSDKSIKSIKSKKDTKD